MNKQKLGLLLKSILKERWGILEISRWAFTIFSDNQRSLDSETQEILEALFSMEDDPQFEYTPDELRIISEKMIKNETGILKQIRDIDQV